MNSIRAGLTHFIDMFAGAGGMSLGFTRAGLACRGWVENDRDSQRTLATNLADGTLIGVDACTVRWPPEHVGVDCLIGGFPCQSFCLTGKRDGFAGASGVVKHMLRAIAELQPKVVVAENVSGLLSHNGGRSLRAILNWLRELDYDAMVHHLNAVRYGVAQERKRLIIVARRRDIATRPWPVMPSGDDRRVTLREVLAGCPESPGVRYSARKAAVLAQVPAGGCWVDLPPEVARDYMGEKVWHTPGGRRGVCRRLAWDEPSLTILCSPAQTRTERCHPDEARPLTVRESARIQGFPDEWEFAGGLTSQYRQVGNAVPPPLAQAVGEHVLAVLGFA